MTSVSPSLASEIAALIGIPWEAGATGPDAYDCWAAAGMVQRRFFGRELPDLRPRTQRAQGIAETRRAWRRTARPTQGDIVEMRHGGRANHVGVWVAGGILHCQRGAGMCFDRPDAIRLMGWRMRFWTPGPRARAGRVQSRGVQALYVPGIDLMLDPGADADALISAHRAIPIEARLGESIKAVLERAGIDAGDIVCFLRRPDMTLDALSEDDPDALLDRVGAIPAEALASREIGPGERLIVTQAPQGGNGSDPLRTILSLAILAAAAYIAAPVAAGGGLGGLGFGGTVGGALGIGAAAGGNLVFGAISILGNLAISALLPPPSPRGIGSITNDVSPTFSASAQSSVARPGAPVPVCFGRHIHQLDDVAPPYVRFENNAQIIHQLLALGEGEHQLEEVRLGDVAVWRDGALTDNIPGVQIEHVLQNTPVTLIDEAVRTNTDVGGLQLDPSAVVGWHAAIPVGRALQAIEIDIAFQQLVTIANDGSSQDRTVEILVEAQQIDDNDQPLGDPFTLETLSFTAASRSAVRSTHRWFVPTGRYRVRLTRQTAAGDSQTFDTALWAGLKGQLPGGRTWSDVELLAVRVEVGETFAAQSARQVRAIKTRKLPIWDGTAWGAPQPTREIAWAVAQILRAHGRLDDIDLDELLALHTTWSAGGDHFDTIFDQSLSLWDALQATLRAGRAQPDQIGRRIRFWRDEPQPIPRQLFSERNIRRGSLVIRPQLPTSERPERLVAQYMDERTWRTAELTVGAYTGRERRERYFGITDTSHLAREVSHDIRASQYRSVRVEFDAEMENRLLLRGDPIALSHKEMTSGISAGIDAWEGTRLILSHDIDWDSFSTSPDMIFTAPDGSVVGPLPVFGPARGGLSRLAYISTVDLTAIEAQLGEPVEQWADRNAAREEPLRAVIGPTATSTMRLIVDNVGQEREGFATVSCLDDDPRAQDAPVQVGGALDGAISGVTAQLFSDSSTVILKIELAIAPDFLSANPSFVYEYSGDGGVSWLPLATTQSAVYKQINPPNITHVRAAALTSVRGPWVSTAIATASLAAPANLVENVAGTYEQTGDLDVSADPVPGASSYRFCLRQGDGTLVTIIERVSPSLSLSVDDMRTAGALLRTLVVDIQAIDATGAAGSGASLSLTNSAPGAPANLVDNGYLLSWDPAPEADVSAWQVEASWATGPEVVTQPQWTWSGFNYGTVTVRALDVVGVGPGAALTRDPPPPDRG